MLASTHPFIPFPPTLKLRRTQAPDPPKPRARAARREGRYLLLPRLFYLHSFFLSRSTPSRPLQRRTGCRNCAPACSSMISIFLTHSQRARKRESTPTPSFYLLHRRF